MAVRMELMICWYLGTLDCSLIVIRDNMQLIVKEPNSTERLGAG